MDPSHAQLMVACGAAIRAERLKGRLAVPLEITNLILVQHAALAVRFRPDEKRFDVDGAYNVRYEIIKKRIDKAVTRGTGERLTQPGKIALVYSHPSEAAEWRAYVEYLQRQGYLTREVEELELDEVQGAHGLPRPAGRRGSHASRYGHAPRADRRRLRRRLGHSEALRGDHAVAVADGIGHRAPARAPVEAQADPATGAHVRRHEVPSGI
ncbi:MAG TPA: hypothetical protein VML54_14545, partial [Candidatus Limnocylindrales bacterium]|nr:hypothetical protein [Candidatus Limnocylindrales bacterium]